MTKFSYLSSVAQKKILPETQKQDGLEDGQTYTLYKINRLPDDEKQEFYSTLIPPEIFTKFRIDPVTLCTQDGKSVFICHCRPRTSFVRIELHHIQDSPDPIFLLEMCDTSFGDLEILFLNMNNPYAERFDIDRDISGNDTVSGMVSRNLPEELRAMEAGLAPGQTRSGLRMFRSFLGQARLFCRRLGIKRVKVEPMTYHNAIMYEFYGFRYMTGRKWMEDIDLEFAPDGKLFECLDGSTLFRQSGFERSIKGRSWAIHDGILKEPWQCPRMYYTSDESGDRKYHESTYHVSQHHHPRQFSMEIA